ncbi:hypothetical protein [Paraburkholderia oxyphila]|uniref:hypothetical protein n=1 Tax=Paraburkholderia oxyphila TaxID=614212 RepID=UPI000693AAB6|nr:hypothetical protein [Paraburkholderia oxyphila]
MSFSIKSFGLGVALPLVVVGVYQVFGEPATLVQPIQVSDALKKSGFTEEALQNMLVDALSELRTTAKGVTPRSPDTEAVLTEFNLPDFSVPGTGLSMRSLVEYARDLLELDSSVYGSATGAPSGFSVDLTLRDAQGESLSIHQTIANNASPARRHGEKPASGSGAPLVMEETLRRAAMQILERQSPLLYADNLLHSQQDECFSDSAKCDFREVRKRYEEIAVDGGKRPDEPESKTAWAMPILVALHFVKVGQQVANSNSDAALAELMLSKIDDLTGDYAGSIGRTRVIREKSQNDKSWAKVLPWAYYNWGVALNDLGCYEAATEVLTEAANENPDYAPAYNALARAYNALSETSVRAGTASPSLTDYREKARDAATRAVQLDPGYQEAYVNLGDASRPLLAASADPNTKAIYGGDEKQAREAYEKAIALNADTAGRARQQLALIPGTAYANMAERTTKKRPECRQGLPRSLLEASGCSDAQIHSAANRGSEFANTLPAGVPNTPNVCNQLGLHPRENSPMKPLRITATATDVESASHQSAPRQRERG